jgi:two-component system response regulator HydG
VRGSVLVVDDDQDLLRLLEAGLGQKGFEVSGFTTAEKALAQDLYAHDVVLSDINLPGMTGIELCTRVASEFPELPVIVMTAFSDLKTAISALRAGAYDYIIKPIELDGLAVRLDRVIGERRNRKEVRRLREVVRTDHGFEGLMGSSKAMLEVYGLVDRVASSEASMLITGESGTGKELVARALHARSRRGEGPFVPLNCAAVPEQLLESELFGHAKGAFTDAKADRPGLMAQASGGTLFLDEIGELPMTMQPKLLRALEERSIRPVGSDREVSIDIRVVAATNRDLEEQIDQGRFREDLYYRVNVIHVALPPLRSRGRDTLSLAQHFLDRFAAQSERDVHGFTAKAAERLMAYSWPGNVRELRNCMERSVALAQSKEITVEDLPARVRNFTASHVVVAGLDPAELVPMEEVERRYIMHVMEAVNGNKSSAAKILGLDRKTLYRKLERYQKSESADQSDFT